MCNREEERKGGGGRKRGRDACVTEKRRDSEGDGRRRLLCEGEKTRKREKRRGMEGDKREVRVVPLTVFRN